MDSSSNRWYRVVESAEFTRQATGLVGSFARWENIKEFIDQHLARDPRRGKPIIGTELYGISLLTSPPL